MKKRILKYLSFTMALLVLTTSIGISKTNHVCFMNMIKEHHVKDACCQKIKVKKSCCEEGHEAVQTCQTEKSNCCKDEIKVFSKSPVFVSKSKPIQTEPVFLYIFNYGISTFQLILEAPHFTNKICDAHGPPICGRQILQVKSQLSV